MRIRAEHAELAGSGGAMREGDAAKAAQRPTPPGGGGDGIAKANGLERPRHSYRDLEERRPTRHLHSGGIAAVQLNIG
jgi:hypothetical protein